MNRALAKLVRWAPTGIVATALACGNGGGSEPVIPEAPNHQATGGGGAAVVASGVGAGPVGSGGAGGALPEPMNDWAPHGQSHDLRAALYVVAPDEIHAVAGDPLEVGDVIALWNGIGWSSMTDGAGGLRPAFHYIPPLELEPAHYVAVVLQHLELWDGLDWNILTADAPGLHAGLQYVDLDTIYAPVGQQIQRWDGLAAAWLPVTDDLPEPLTMTRGFHWVSDLEIYAVAGNETGAQIQRWDGAAWLDHAAPMEGLEPELHFVAPTEIYAVIGSQVCVWNGSTWSPYTTELSALNTAFHFAGPESIFAIAGGARVWHWTP